jgi:hypothetical protein
MGQMNEKEDKEIEIFVNAQSEHVYKNSILSYEDIVTLAFQKYEPNPKISYTVVYCKGDNSHKPKGELVKGESLKVKEGMIINVTRTDRS